MAIEEWRAPPGAESAVLPLGTAATVVGGVMDLGIVKAVTGLAAATLGVAVCEIVGPPHGRALHHFHQGRQCPAYRSQASPSALRRAADSPLPFPEHGWKGDWSAPRS